MYAKVLLTQNIYNLFNEGGVFLIKNTVKAIYKKGTEGIFITEKHFYLMLNQVFTFVWYSQHTKEEKVWL